MKNIFSWVLGLVVVVLATTSCSSSETYADKLKEERKQIDRFLSAQGFEVLSSYPADSVFKENQFFRDPDTGVYINVIDSGNGKRASATDLADVYFRFYDTATLPVDNSTIDKTNGDAGGSQPVSFIYGNSNSYTSTNTSSYYNYIYLSPGVTVPLKYVGEGAVVRLIVPFAQGSYYQSLSYQAIYYGRLKYEKINN